MSKPTIIHIYRNRIDSNRKNGTNEPPIIVRKGKRRLFYGNTVEIEGPCRIVYRPNEPLDCGARVWIETDSKVKAVE